ncbi:MAG: hypothetical protein CM1200mP41_01330 [Gammaproteobacteria bacterium]|nr:MAG: hypothetical protein CM1200mP41_01330 [Gammaproteobacteria bacterium]
MVNIDIGINEIDQLVAFAKNNAVAFTVIGPEAPLVNGVVDAFDEVGLRCLGPNRGAAQLEGSKAFTKSFLKRHRIPTAAYSVFDDADEAIDWVKQHPGPCVIKADGLAAGKGVTVAATEQIAVNAIHQCLRERAFGSAGDRIVIEEFLVGEEASFICLVDGGICVATCYIPGPQSARCKRSGAKYRWHGCLFASTGDHGTTSPTNHERNSTTNH